MGGTHSRRGQSCRWSDVEVSMNARRVAQRVDRPARGPSRRWSGADSGCHPRQVRAAASAAHRVGGPWTIPPPFASPLATTSHRPDGFLPAIHCPVRVCVCGGRGRPLATIATRADSLTRLRARTATPKAAEEPSGREKSGSNSPDRIPADGIDRRTSPSDQTQRGLAPPGTSDGLSVQPPGW